MTKFLFICWLCRVASRPWFSNESAARETGQACRYCHGAMECVGAAAGVKVPRWPDGGSDDSGKWAEFESKYRRSEAS